MKTAVILRFSCFYGLFSLIFRLFYRGVVEVPNPFCYDILAICEEGKNFPRYFEYTPTKVGSYKLTICVYDADKNLLGKGETLLVVAEPKSPEKPVNILCIGDSLTSHGQWVAESYRRLVSNDGNLWQMETIIPDMIKFMRCGGHKGTLKKESKQRSESRGYINSGLLLRNGQSVFR